MHILIVGSGIGGLTLGYWLRQYGMQVTLIEKVATFRPIGSLAVLREDGFGVAERMHLVDELRLKSLNLQQQVIHDAHGRTLRSIALKSAQQEILQIRRSDWLNILYEHVNKHIPVQFQKAVQSLQETSDGVDVTFTDGSRARYDLVVGADGIHSTVRSQVFPASSPRPMGLHVMTFILEHVSELVAQLHLPAGSLNEWYLPGAYVSLPALSENAIGAILMYRAAPEPRKPGENRKARLAERFATAPREVRLAIQAIEDTSTIYDDDLAQVILPHWHQGRVVLIGDAAHATTPILGIGGSKAMLGAYVLARELAHAPSYSAAFASYEEKMRPSITQVQEKSRSIGKFLTQRNTLLLTSKQLLFTYAPQSFLQRLRRPLPQEGLLNEQ